MSQRANGIYSILVKSVNAAHAAYITSYYNVNTALV